MFAFACQYIVSPCGRASNRTVTQMRHPFLVEGRPKCARQSLASTLSAPRVAATSYCDPGCHANVITPCTPCLNVPNEIPSHFTLSHKGRFESKNPHFYTGHHKENGFVLTRDALSAEKRPKNMLRLFLTSRGYFLVLGAV